jgi:hypothetical protein
MKFPTSALCRYPGNAARAVALCTVVMTQAHAEWRFPHADNGNTGFARINTRPADIYNIQWAGSVAPGANPVVGPMGPSTSELSTAFCVPIVPMGPRRGHGRSTESTAVSIARQSSAAMVRFT